MLAEQTKIVATPDQVSSDLAGESVILNLKTGTYFGLNEVGAHIWQLIQEPKTVLEVCEAILETYEVEPEQCKQGVQSLLQDLLQSHLIDICDG